MNALTFRGLRTIVHEDVPDATLRDPGDAIVEVELAGLCGSDLHVYHGREVGLDAGTIMGHEFVGRVVEVGAGVRGFAAGDHVASPFSTSCGGCYYCSLGLSARCSAGQLFGWVQGGVGLHGAQARYVRVPLADATLCHLPDAIASDAALLLCDVLPTGHHCARMAGVAPGGCYAVIGLGPVGLMTVLAARELGAERLFAIDAVDERLAFAARLGAIPVDARRAEPVQVVRQATEGRGADAVLEAVGSPAAGRLAFELVRPGGTISAVGVHHEAAFTFSPAQAYERNLSYHIGRCPARSLMEGLLPLALRRQDEISALITHRLPLSRGPEAYELFDQKREGCLKVALVP